MSQKKKKILSKSLEFIFIKYYKKLTYKVM